MKNPIITSGDQQQSEWDSSSNFSLRLYISGMTPRSSEAILRTRAICEEFLAGRYTLEIVDLYQHPSSATNAQIIATPTLVKLSPLPLRRLVGNLSDKQRVLNGLGIPSAKEDYGKS